MPTTLLKKIPKKFIELIEDERDTAYVVKIEEPLENQKLMEETEIILGIIYRDFLCDENEKQNLKKQDSEHFAAKQREIERELREKYSVENLFKKDDKNKDELQKNEEVMMITITEEKWYTKIKAIIMKFFHRNK